MSSSLCQDVSTVLKVVEGRPWGLNNVEMALAMCVPEFIWVHVCPLCPFPI